MKIPERFPKVKAPYERTENESGDYTANDVIVNGYQWVFDRAEEVEAVEKLHGTNCAIYMEHGEVITAATRMGNRDMNEVDPFGERSHHYITRGVQNSINRNYLYDIENGWHFGELVGPSLHDNPYELDEHLFVPFEWLRQHCSYRSYGEYSTEFDAISGWFEEELFSLFFSRIHGVDLEASSVSNGTFVEGIIFVHPDFEGSIRPSDLEMHSTSNYDSVAPELAKVRRDMFDWFEGSL